MPTNTTERVHCNSCRQLTNHSIVGTHKVEDEDEQYGIWWNTTSNILECCGCGTVKFRQSEAFSENEPEEKITYFPPEVSRTPHDWVHQLPKDMKALMSEIYSALHAENRRLAAMG